MPILQAILIPQRRKLQAFGIIIYLCGQENFCSQQLKPDHSSTTISRILLLRNENWNSTAFMCLYTWIAFITTDPLPLRSDQSMGALHAGWLDVALHRRKSRCWLPVLIHAADTECWLSKAGKSDLLNVQGSKGDFKSTKIFPVS